MPLSRRSKNVLYGVWWIALAVAAVGVGIRYRERAAPSVQADHVRFDAPVTTVVAGSSDSLQVFVPGKTFAALIVSPICAYCVEHADVLGERLAEISADHRVVIALAFPDSVARQYREHAPSVVTVVPTDPASLRDAGIEYVPTLVATGRDGSVAAVHVGVPSRRIVRQVTALLKAESGGQP